MTSVVYKLFQYASSITNHLESVYSKLLNQQIQNINKKKDDK